MAGVDPEAFRPLFQRASAAHGVPLGLLEAVAWQESKFNPNARGKAGELGMMQFMPATARDLGLRDPFNPEEAVPAAAQYLRQHYDRFGSWEVALAAYNAGQGRVQQVAERHGLGTPAFYENLPRITQRYIPSVMGYATQGRWAGVDWSEQIPSVDLRSAMQLYGIGRPDASKKPTYNARSQLEEAMVAAGLRRPDPWDQLSGLKPEAMRPELRQRLLAEPTPMEALSGERYVVGPEQHQQAQLGSLPEVQGLRASQRYAETLPQQAEGGLLRQMGKEFVDGFRVFEEGIAPRERLFRGLNVASLAVPWGFAARAPMLMKAFPMLNRATQTLRGQVAVGAASEGLLSGALTAIRGPDEQGNSHVVGATVLGAALGGVIGRYAGGAKRNLRLAQNREVAARFQDAGQLVRANSPIFTDQYAIIPGGFEGLAPEVQATLLKTVQRKAAQAGLPDSFFARFGKQDGLVLPGMDAEHAVQLAREIRADRILTSDGLVDLQRGLLYPMSATESAFGGGVRASDDLSLVFRLDNGKNVAFRPKLDMENAVRLGQPGPAGTSVERLSRLFAPDESFIGRNMERFRQLDMAPVLRNWYAKVVRRQSPLDDLERYLGSGDRASRSISAQMELFPTRHGVFTEQSLLHGIPKVNSITKGGDGRPQLEYAHRGLLKIWQDLRPDEVEAFRNYGVARRVVQIIRDYGEDAVPRMDGKPVLSLHQARELVEASPRHFANVFDETVQWQNAFLRETLVESGILTPEAFQRITRQADGVSLRDYIPLSEVSLDPKHLDPTAPNLAIFDPIRRLGRVDDEKVFSDWMPEIVKRSAMFARLAEQNRMGRLFTDLVKESVQPGPRGTEAASRLGLRKVAAPKGFQPTDDVLGAAARDLGVEGALQPHGFTMGGENFIRVVREGKGEWYQITDQPLWEALKGLGPVELDGLSDIVRFASGPAGALRAGITLGFGFLAKNPIRDTLFGFVNMGMNPMAPLRGVASMVKRDEFWQAWVAAGGPRSALVSLDRPYTKNILQDISRMEGGKLRNVVTSPSEWLDALRALSEGMENVSRLGMFRQTWGRMVKEGADPMDALVRAAVDSKQVSVNFSMHGSHQVTGALRATTTFWNAIVQGLDQLRVSAQRDPAGFFMRGGLLTMGSVGLYMVNRQDEEYRYGIPQWEKNLFWHVRAGDEWIRLPKPFEPGLIFGSLPERFLEALDDADPRALDEYAKQLLGQSIGAVVPMPTVVQPFAENVANRSFFTNAPIIPMSQRMVDPDFQGGPQTSRLAQGLARFLNQGVDHPSDKVSPFQLDNVLQGWTGELGGFIYRDVPEAAVDAFTALALGKEVDPVKNMQQGVRRIPGFRTFMSSYPYASQAMEDLYRQGERARSVAATAAYLEDSYRLDDLMRFTQENMTTLALGPAAEQALQEMAELRDQRDAIMQSDAPLDQKREAVRTLTELMSQRAIPIVKLLDDAGLRRW